MNFRVFSDRRRLWEGEHNNKSKQAAPHTKKMNNKKKRMLNFNKKSYEIFFHTRRDRTVIITIPHTSICQTGQSWKSSSLTFDLLTKTVDLGIFIFIVRQKQRDALSKKKSSDVKKKVTKKKKKREGDEKKEIRRENDIYQDQET